MPKKKLPKKIVVKQTNIDGIKELKLEIVYHELFKAIAKELLNQAK